MDPVTQHDTLTAETERSDRQPVARQTLHELFTERFARLEQLEDAIRRAPASAEARLKLNLLHRAKFSTWLDLEALRTAEARRSA